MNEKLDAFIKQSPIAKRIRVEPKIVIRRTSLSPNDLAGIKREKTYGPIPGQELLCELEIDDKVFAVGKIIKKTDGYYFKVKQLIEEVSNENK